VHKNLSTARQVSVIGYEQHPQFSAARATLWGIPCGYFRAQLVIHSGQ